MIPKMKTLCIFFAMLAGVVGATEYFVSPTGNDLAEGSAARPWRTIQRAADIAVAGDVVTIRAGIYREWVRPANAGREGAPIVYRAAKGEKVVVTGADLVKGWTKRPDGLWSAKVSYATFCGMNPFTDVIFGDWFAPGGRARYRTRLIQNGKPLELHGAEIFDDAKASSGNFLVNIAGLTFGSRTINGDSAVNRTGPRAGFDTKWGKELGWITEGATCEYAGLDLSTPEARKMQVHFSSRYWDTQIEFFDAANPTRPLATLVVPKTGEFTTYKTLPLTLPDSAAGVKALRLRFGYPTNSKSLLQRGHAALIPGMVTGTIIAAFERDPNECVPELVTRPACFYPTVEFRDYQTLQGIAFENAGPNWAPPTSEQVGMVGTNWSRGWVIEDCSVSGASCTGITLGKYGDEFDNFSKSDSQRYSATIARAAENGLDRVGHHVVRRCRIVDCGQAGICGSLGAVFSTIEDCEISYCHWKKPYGGAEMAGIKIHGAVDFTIARCRIHHCGELGGIWFDWMAQGARIADCTLWANNCDLFFEVDHGPVLVEGCDLLSNRGKRHTVFAYSQSVAFVGNRINGKCAFWGDRRRTPIFAPHSVKIHSLDGAECECTSGGYRFFNNIMTSAPVFTKNTHPNVVEDNWIVPESAMKVDEATGKLTFTPPADSKAPEFKPVTSDRLGRSVVIHQEFPAPKVQGPRK